ncbi:MAG: ribulose-phosphate 3-epimerase [Oscillospiraceae bacterium]
MIKIAPSILSADFTVLGDEIRDVLSSGAEWVHFDVMDGVFVPNINLGIGELTSVSKSIKAFYDVHLMIIDPIKYIDGFVKAGANAISFHVESKSNAVDTIEKIHSHDGVLAGIVLRPITPAESVFELLPLVDFVLIMTVEPGFGGQSFMPDMCSKIEKIKKKATELGTGDMLIEVDGGITKETAPLVIEAGANVLVAGSSVFGQSCRKRAISELLDAAPQ